MQKIDFKEKNLMGGWQIEVWNGPKAYVGNIRKNPAINGYSYFSGSNNTLNSSFSDADLDT